MEKKRPRNYARRIRKAQELLGSNCGVEILRAKVSLERLGIDAFVVFRVEGNTVYRVTEIRSTGELMSMLSGSPKQKGRFRDAVILDKEGNLAVLDERGKGIVRTKDGSLLDISVLREMLEKEKRK